MKYISQSENQTKKIAKNLAKSLKGGEIIALIGDLGSGKTVFTQGLAQELGIKQGVRSPTFVLMRVYKLKNLRTKERKNEKFIRYLVHIDAYRLKNEKELVDIGVGEYLNNPKVITVIEWAGKVKKIWEKLPNKIIVNFKHGKKKNERMITITRLLKKPHQAK